MRKLLSADIHRLFKSRVLLFCMLAAFVSSLWFSIRYTLGDEVKLVSWSRIMQMFPFLPILHAVFASLFIGVEYQDRTLRNKLICGHSRVAICCSLLLTVTLGCFAIVAAWVLGGAAGMGLMIAEFVELPKTLPFYVIGIILLTAAVSAILTTVGMLVPNRAVAAVTAVLLAFGLILLGGAIYSALCEPSTTMPAIVIDGGIGFGDPEPNPRYVSGVLRDVYNFLMDVLPSGQALLLANREFAHPAVSLISSALIFLAVSAVCAIIFRRKDLK